MSDFWERPTGVDGTGAGITDPAADSITRPGALPSGVTSTKVSVPTFCDLITERAVWVYLILSWIVIFFSIEAKSPPSLVDDL